MANDKLDRLLENYFRDEPPAKEPFDLGALSHMINEVLEYPIFKGLLEETYVSQTPEFIIERAATEEKGEGDSDQVTVIRRPVIKITELWGKTENGDREIMESLMNNIGGNTIQEKVESVNAFLEAAAPAPGEGDISKIMSYLIFLDTFASIINDYGASVSGFLFEAFLAALMGGTSVQIDDPEQVGAAAGSLPIEDVQLAIQRGEEADPEIVPYSLKVLRKQGVVHGSFKNIVDYFLDPAEGRKTDSIVYLIVIKDADKKEGGKFGSWNGNLKFYEFTITRDNFLQLIGAPTEVPVYDYLEFTFPRSGTINPEKNVYPQSAKAALRGVTRYKNLDGSDITEPVRVKKGDKLLMYTDTGKKQQIVKGSAAKLYSPEQYADVAGKFGTAEEVDRQVFAALQDTKGYKTQAQWSIGHGVYTHKPYYKGQINLDPELLKSRAEDYTQSLNGSIVKIFNALGDLSDNINRYFIGAEGQNRKSIGTRAKADADVLKKEVNATIKS